MGIPFHFQLELIKRLAGPDAPMGISNVPLGVFIPLVGIYSLDGNAFHLDWSTNHLTDITRKHSSGMHTIRLETIHASVANTRCCLGFEQVSSDDTKRH